MILALGQANDIAYTAGMHTHDVWEIVINVFGSGISVIGNKEYPFTEGTILCIPPHVKHGKSSKEGFRDYFMHVDSIRGVNPDSSDPIVLSDDSEHTFENLMSIMLHLLYSDKPGKMTMITSLSHVCMQLIADLGTSLRLNPAVSRIQNLLISGYADPELDLNKILGGTGYSAEYMRKKFSQDTGVSPLEYLTNLRITHAKNLLAQKNRLRLSVKEIALLCGFYDSHYFSTTFRKAVGMTPKDFALKAALEDSDQLVQKVDY